MQMRPKESRVAILVSDKIDFEIKAVKGDKEGHYIMIKGSIQEEDITIINTNIEAPQYARQMLKDLLYTGNTEKAYKIELKQQSKWQQEHTYQ